MKNYLLEKEITFNPDELKTAWAFNAFSISGDYIISFVGPLNYPTFSPEHLPCLHFIAEISNSTHKEIGLCQKLLLTLIKNHLGPNCYNNGTNLYFLGLPLVISQVKYDVSSNFIHASILIENMLNMQLLTMQTNFIEIKPLAIDIMVKYCEEINSLPQN